VEILRTTDDRFSDLDGYPFAPHYLETDDGLRMHFVDEGPEEGPVVLLLHGEPTWSYLYRKMIPRLVDAGLRCVAPDLIGFGRSDKPAARSDYSYQRHVDWTRSILERLDLHDVTLVAQDWGGLIGLRLVAEHAERFAGVVAANTTLPTGDVPPNEAFMRWREYSQSAEALEVGKIIARSTVRPVSDSVRAGYDAPFPDESFKAGAREFPVLVPIDRDDPARDANRAAWQRLRQFTKPFLCAFSDSDLILGDAYQPFLKLIPGAAGQPHTTIERAGHYLQEDNPADLVAAIVPFVTGRTQ
jgi:haloalkane dehalogenase